jgi:hypothetical protein
MLKRRWELRARITATGELFPDGIFPRERYMFKRHAQRKCDFWNDLRREQGYTNFYVYIHDLQEEN